MENQIIASPSEAEQAADIAEGGEALKAPAEASAPERREAFEKLIRGEYKAEFDERVQRIIDRRFREARTLREESARMRPLLDALKAKYGESDAEKLLQRVEAENRTAGDGEKDTDSMPKIASETEGETARKDADEPEYRNAARAAILRDRGAREILGAWKADEERIQKEIPGFSLQKEMRDRRFCGLLRAGVDVGTAYETVHAAERMETAMRYAAERTREMTLNGIRARGLRPEENGLSGRGASRVSPMRVENMSRAQREDIERRCARGEKVYFA